MKTVVAFGVFDLLHPGHTWFLREAAKLGDRLVVVVARDRNVKARKGVRPAWNETRRLAAVKAATGVAEARLGREDWVKHEEMLDEIKPDVIVLGYDQDVNIPKGPWEVVRLKAHCPNRYKTSILRKKASEPKKSRQTN